MVLDKDKGVIKPRYLMYDIMQFEVKILLIQCIVGILYSCDTIVRCLFCAIYVCL